MGTERFFFLFSERLIIHFALLASCHIFELGLPTTVLSEREMRDGRPGFPRHVSWEQTCRMGRGDEASRPRAAHVAHMISARVRLVSRCCRDNDVTRHFLIRSFSALLPLTLGPLPFLNPLYSTDGRFHRESAKREEI